MNLYHVFALYEFLGHQPNYSDVRCVDVNKGVLLNRKIIKSKTELQNWVTMYNGKGNCFIGRNPRDAKGEVVGVSHVSFDIDVRRPKGVSATDEQIAEAIKEVERILSLYPNGYYAISGNGVLLIYKLPEMISDIKEFSIKLKKVEAKIRSMVSDAFVIDSTYDASRMIKLIGTVSTKGNIRRLSRWITIPTKPYKICEELYSDIVSQTIPQENTIFIEAMKYPSRSEADYALAVHYKKAGLSKEDTLKALQKHVLGRNDRLDDHIRIVEKVFSEPIIESIPSYFTPNGELEKYKERLKQRKLLSDSPKMPFGIKQLDDITWGLRTGDITVLSARTGVGKTSLALMAVISLLRANNKVLLFSTEMSVDLILDRLIQCITKLPSSVFRKGDITKEQQELIDKACNELAKYKNQLIICDSASPDINTIAKMVEDIKPNVVIVDHIQHISGDTRSSREIVSSATRKIKDLCLKFQCSALILSQIKRLIKDIHGEEVPPTLSDLKESGTLEEEASVVIILSRVAHDNDSGISTINVEVAKNRYGRIGSFEIMFDPERCEII